MAMMNWGRAGCSQTLFRAASAGLLRVCAYPVELCGTAHARGIQAALAEFPDFAEDLRRSSDSLSRAIDRDQGKHRRSRGWEDAAWRYLLRATRMPIPYGLLVGIGTVPLSDRLQRVDTNASVITQNVPEVRQNWIESSERALADRHLFLWALHPTLYRLADGLRYLHIGQEDEVRMFQGTEEVVDAIAELKGLGLFSLEELETHLAARAKLSRVEARSLADGLVEHGFLVASATKSRPEGSAERAAAAAKVLDHRSISLSFACADQVGHAVSFLARILTPPPDPFQRLRQAFAARWREQSVPLMLMFDPDVGVDIDGRQNRQLGELLRGCQPRTVEPMAQEGRRIDFGWTSKELEGLKVLDLSDLQIAEDQFVAAHLPSSLAAIFQIDSTRRDTIWLQTAAGGGAARLVSRTALQDPNAAVLLTEVAQWDKRGQSCLHVEVFVAPTIQDAPTVGRMNPFEAVLATCGAPIDNAIPLSAVEVRLREGEFILVDSRTGRLLEVHHSEPLRLDGPDRAPHLRFLARMAARPAFRSLRWKWLPHEEAAHLPRVVYNDVVLHPESWRIQWEEVRNLSLVSVRHLLSARGVPELLLAKPEWLPAQVISSRQDGSIRDLMKILRRAGVVYLQELCPGSFLEIGAARHVCEFMLPLRRNDPSRVDDRIGDVRPAERATVAPVEAAKGMPGWLSFEIGTFESRTDLLILELILPLVRHLIDGGMVTQWHYTRGDSTEGATVNVRLHVSDEPDAVTSIVQENCRVNGRRLARGCKKTMFVGEIDRYGGAQIYNEVLRHFEIQSWDCAAWLDTYPIPDDRARVLRQALFCASAFRTACTPSDASGACLLLASRVRPQSIALAAARTIASGLFRTHRDLLLEKVNDTVADNNLLAASMATFARQRSRVELLFSTLHMYGNRLFRHAQRDHEHVAYLLAAKLLVSRDILSKTRAC